MSKKQKLTPQQEYYQGMTSISENIQKRALKSDMMNGLSNTKNHLLDSISGIQFRIMNSKNEVAELGEFLKELEVNQNKVGQMEDKLEKEVKQLSKKIKVKQEQISKTLTAFQETAGSLVISMGKTGKQIIINDKQKGEVLALRDEASDLDYQIKQLTGKLDEKINEINDQKQKVSFITVDIKQIKQKDDLVLKQIKSAELKIKSKQLLQKDCELKGKIRQKMNNIEKKYAEAQLKDLKNEQLSLPKEVNRLQLLLKNEEGQLSRLKKQQEQLSQSISKLKGQAQKLNSRIKQTTSQIENYENKITVLQEQLAQLQYQKQLKEREKEQNHLSENNYENLKTLIINKQKIISQLLAKYDTVAKNQATELDQIEDQIEIYQKELKTIDNQIINETVSIEKNKEIFKKIIDPAKGEKFNALLFNRDQKNEGKKL